MKGTWHQSGRFLLEMFLWASELESRNSWVTCVSLFSDLFPLSFLFLSILIKAVLSLVCSQFQPTPSCLPKLVDGEGRRPLPKSSVLSLRLIFRCCYSIISRAISHPKTSFSILLLLLLILLLLLLLRFCYVSSSGSKSCLILLNLLTESLTNIMNCKEQFTSSHTVCILVIYTAYKPISRTKRWIVF